MLIRDLSFMGQQENEFMSKIVPAKGIIAAYLCQPGFCSLCCPANVIYSHVYV